MAAIEMSVLNTESATTSARRRNLASKILLAVFCLSTVLSVIAVWTRNQIEDTDRYVRAVAPLAQDPAIQSALINRVETQFSTVLNEVATRDTLTDRDRYLAAPLASLLQQFVHDTTQEFVTSDQFPAMWEQLNRTAHPAVSAVLLGKGTQSISTSKGQITLDLAPLMTEVINRLRDRGVDIVDRIQVEQLDTTFVIFQSEDLANIQDAVGVLESLAAVLPILALVSLGAALILSTERRRMLVWTGLSLAASMAALLVLLAFARWWVVDHFPATVSRDAATVFFETIGNYLRDAVRLLSLIGLTVAAVAFATRPSGWLSRERKAWRRSLQSTWRSARSRWTGLEQGGSWLNRHRVGLAAAIFVGACVLIIARDPLNAERATRILVIAAIGIGLLEVLHMKIGAPAAARLGVVAAPPRPVEADGGAVSHVVAAPVTTDDARVEIAALARTLSSEDVRILRRVAVALRDAPVTRP